MFDEQHYTVKEVAALWKYSHDTILRWFADDPDVIVNKKENVKRGKRGRRQISIPESAMQRVHRKHLNLEK
jgi:hypothetical protein